MEPWVFWNSTREWPITPPADGVVFLAAAMHRIARAQFPDWTGREPWLGLPLAHHYLPASQALATPAQMRTARELLGTFRNGVDIRPLGAWERTARPIATLPVINPPTAPLSNNDWEIARSRATEAAEFATTAAQRWGEVLDGTFAFLASGLLETKLRQVNGGGDYEDAPADLWRTELRHVRPRFGLCQVDLAHPFNQQSYEDITGFRIDDAEPQFRLIFVTAPSLDAILAKMTRAAGAASQLESDGGKTMLTHRAEYVAYIKGEVEANPDGKPAGRDRKFYIAERVRFKLPKAEAEAAYKDALKLVPGNKWSKTGPQAKP